MFVSLRDAGFQVEFRYHAKAILKVDFPELAAQLEGILLDAKIPIEEIIGSGGGETKGTQRLRRALQGNGWRKHRFEMQRTIDGIAKESISHEVDHIARFEAGVVALEVEWNNKDPFFDRDLENFKRLHADGAISLGVLITRGISLQEELPSTISLASPSIRHDSSLQIMPVGAEARLHSRRLGQRPSCKANSER